MSLIRLSGSTPQGAQVSNQIQHLGFVKQRAGHLLGPERWAAARFGALGGIAVARTGALSGGAVARFGALGCIAVARTGALSGGAVARFGALGGGADRGVGRRRYRLRQGRQQFLRLAANGGVFAGGGLPQTDAGAGEVPHSGL